MGANRLTLINQLANTPLVDGRYSDIQVVNCDPVTGQHKADGGCLSVVFSARDQSTGRLVAIKFFDPDIDLHNHVFRYPLFLRECMLLEKLHGQERCLQLVQATNQLDLSVTDPATGYSLTTPTYYFVVEWIEDDVNDFFYLQEGLSADEKLQVFRDIVLAVNALHQQGIYHRDLKPSNLRVAVRDTHKRVVAIDLGTAAAFDSAPVGASNDYYKPVGTRAYSPIEAQCFLSGVRRLGIYSDIYALGCMLHDLFNLDYFFVRLGLETGYWSCFGVCNTRMAQLLQTTRDEDTLLREWNAILGIAQTQVTLPAIDGPGHSVPISVVDALNRLLHMLVNVDYRNRPHDFNVVLHHVDLARTILNNHAADRRAKEIRLEKRRRRIEKLRRQQMRLAKCVNGVSRKGPSDA